MHFLERLGARRYDWARNKKRKANTYKEGHFICLGPFSTDKLDVDRNSRAQHRCHHYPTARKSQLRSLTDFGGLAAAVRRRITKADLEGLIPALHRSSRSLYK
jgi:hypothetical protein